MSELLQVFPLTLTSWERGRQWIQLPRVARIIACRESCEQERLPQLIIVQPQHSQTAPYFGRYIVIAPPYAMVSVASEEVLRYIDTVKYAGLGHYFFEVMAINEIATPTVPFSNT